MMKKACTTLLRAARDVAREGESSACSLRRFAGTTDFAHSGGNPLGTYKRKVIISSPSRFVGQSGKSATVYGQRATWKIDFDQQVRKILQNSSAPRDGPRRSWHGAARPDPLPSPRRGRAASPPEWAHAGVVAASPAPVPIMPPQSNWENPLMGWTSTADPQEGLRVENVSFARRMRRSHCRDGGPRASPRQTRPRSTHACPSRRRKPGRRDGTPATLPPSRPHRARRG